MKLLKAVTCKEADCIARRATIADPAQCVGQRI